MACQHGIVVDQDGFYRELVLADFKEENGDMVWQPRYYQMQEGETLIFKDIAKAMGMARPCWDGGRWVERGEREISPEMVEELREEKLREINAGCKAAIARGVDVETSFGLKHFSLTAEDQINLAHLLGQLDKARNGQPTTIDLAKGISYHADGELCRFWPPEDFALMGRAATAHTMYQQTYCNHLREYAKGLRDYQLLHSLYYGMPLPEDLTMSLNHLLPGIL